MSTQSAHHIKLDAVSFSYPDHRVLTDVTFAVPAGRVTGLIGENGSGKSTLLSLIARTLEPDVGEITTPPITGFIAQEVQLPFSEPAKRLIDDAVAELRAIEKQITELSAHLDEEKSAVRFDQALARAQESGVWELDSRIATVLAGLGLADVDLSTPLGEMSGGQRRRFALAALLLRPVDALVLDEPTNHLDDEGVDFLIEELKNFSGPVLVASHDRFFLDSVADQLVDLDAGLGEEGGHGMDTKQGTVFSGSFSEYLRYREKVRTRWQELYNAQDQERRRLANQASVTEDDVFHHHESKGDTGASKKFHADRAAKTLGNRLRSARNRLEDLERNALPAPPGRLRFHGIPEHSKLSSLGEPAIHARRISVQDRLDPLTLKVQPGEQWLIEGPNGSGKSTLLQVINGQVEPDSGEIRIPEEVTISKLNQDDAWDDLSLTAAEIFEAHTPAGVPDLVKMGLMSKETAGLPLERLSLGQRRRVSLGIILASPPDILLLDEPTNHLSLALAEELEKALDDFPGTVVLATHDRWIRRRWRGRPRAKMMTLSARAES